MRWNKSLFLWLNISASVSCSACFLLQLLSSFSVGFGFPLFSTTVLSSASPDLLYSTYVVHGHAYKYFLRITYKVLVRQNTLNGSNWATSHIQKSIHMQSNQTKPHICSQFWGIQAWFIHWQRESWHLVKHRVGRLVSSCSTIPARTTHV